MKIAKDIDHKDNYLIATVGEIEGKPVWLNLAESRRGKLHWFKKSKQIAIPKKLEAKFTIIIDCLEKKTL